MRAHCRIGAEPSCAFEVNRYLGWPGQAPSYKVGERIWLQARDEARARQGADFDLRPSTARHSTSARSASTRCGGAGPVVTRGPSRPRLGLPRPAGHAAGAGVEPEVIVSGVDESRLDGLPPAELALQLAELKCAAVAERDDVPTDALVLGCDSVLELDGQAHGKPADADEAVGAGGRCAVAPACCTPVTASRDTADGRHRRGRPHPRSCTSPTSTTTRSRRTSPPASRCTSPVRSRSTASAVPSSGDRGRPPHRGGGEPPAAARAGGRARPPMDRPLDAG